MAANKPGKAEILAAFFDDGTYSPLFTDGAVSAAYGCANGQNAYVVFEDGSPVGVQDIEKNIRVLEMAAETGAPVVTFATFPQVEFCTFFRIFCNFSQNLCAF